MAQTGIGQSFEWVNIAAGMMLKRLTLTAAHDALHTRRQDCMGREDSWSQPTIVLMRCCRHWSAEQQCALLAALHAAKSTHRLFLLLARLRNCTCDGSRQHSLPRPWGPDQQDALGQLASQCGELVRVAQILHHLLQLPLHRGSGRWVRVVFGLITDAVYAACDCGLLHPSQLQACCNCHSCTGAGHNSAHATAMVALATLHLLPCCWPCLADAQQWQRL